MDLRPGRSSLGGPRKFYEELGERLCEAVAIVARYDSVRDKDGETRRERNESFETESPEVEVPDHGAFIWEWFWELRQAQPPGFSGPVPISNVEVSVWCQLTGNIIRREELAILRALDARFCIEIEAESEAIREREATT
ncbi:hypothetical protein EME01_63270 [Sinorhizobium meliloti]|nr:hypothetical protein Q1M62_20510 [Sinorhizobium meliloti]WKL41925.1 hypothetical protein Q1M64_21690 [Sinorhizobium meliloti]GEC42255.1 hypothetical protein EME01_63270 [Sinorhizobium meliloti]